MKKTYISDMETLEVGNNNLSKHLAWLLRMTMYLTVSKNNNAFNSVVFSKNLPKAGNEKNADNIWGMFHAASRSIVINLEQHLSNVIELVQRQQSMHNSIRVLLLHELIDSSAHEAWHAKACMDMGNWENDDLDEDGARKRAQELSWSIAELWDVNIETFGPLLDSFLQDLYKDLKEDVQEDDCKEWKKIQFHMLDNDINYYNPDSGVEIRTIREVFQAQEQPEVPWMDIDNPLFTSFSPVKSIAERVAEEDSDIADLATTKPPSNTTDTKILSPAPIYPIVADINDIKEIQPAIIGPNTTTQPIPADYDPLSDCACEMLDPFDDDIITPDLTSEITSPPATNNAGITNKTVAAAAPVVDGSVELEKPAIPQMDVLRIQQIAEQVLRRMFHHVSTKCEFNTAGGYNNTGAVLDPINITDIEGASELFVKQDTLDANGNFISHVDINGFIKGLPSNEGLPRYTFYMNMGGKLYKRVFIAQNPNKTKADGITPTAYAAEAKANNRIMLLIADGAGITANIKLEDGKTLGQEEFNIWDKK